MPIRRRRSMSKKAGVPPPPTPKVPVPRQSELKEIFKKLITANISNRIAALGEALDWWDNAQKNFLTNSKLEPQQIKLMSLALKSRNLAIGAGTEPEKEQALLTALKLVEKIWVKKLVITHVEYYKKYEENKVTLEAKEKAYAERFQAITEAIDSAFKDLGLTYQVVKNTTQGGIREFDGEGKVLLTLNLAKELREKYKTEGLLPVLFSEAQYAMQCAGVDKINDPDNPGQTKHVLSYKKMVEAFPKVLEGILTYMANLPKNKIFKGYNGSLQATAPTVAQTTTTKVHTPKVKSSSGSGQTRAHGSRKGTKVGGRYAPGSAMAELYTRLSDQKPHSISDLTKGLSVNNPMDRLRYLMKHGKRSGNWQITISGNTIQMTIP